MIHLDIIRYVLNPLISYPDAKLIANVLSITMLKKHHLRVRRYHCKLNIQLDRQIIVIVGNKVGNKVCLMYRKDNKLHRTDKDVITGLTLPAVIWNDGTKGWYKNGQYHREDKDENGVTLPARIWSNGDKVWCKEGQYYRDDKDEYGRVLPAVIYRFF